MPENLKPKLFSNSGPVVLTLHPAATLQPIVSATHPTCPSANHKALTFRVGFKLFEAMGGTDPLLRNSFTQP
jgi:hypothetical protein